MTLDSVFMYGSFMHPDVLARVGVVDSEYRPAALSEWALVFQPTANLVPLRRSICYGVVISLTANELGRLYAAPQMAVYNPTEVTVSLLSKPGSQKVATYLAPLTMQADPDPAYLALLVDAARRHNLPEVYIAQLAAWRPSDE